MAGRLAQRNRGQAAVSPAVLLVLVALPGCGPLPDSSESPLLIDRAAGPDLPDYRGNGGMGPGGANGGMGVGGGIQAGGGPALP